MTLDSVCCKSYADFLLQYGNNAELKVKYTKLALLVKVLSWAERSRSGTREDPVTLE